MYAPCGKGTSPLYATMWTTGPGGVGTGTYPVQVSRSVVLWMGGWAWQDESAFTLSLNLSYQGRVLTSATLSSEHTINDDSAWHHRAYNSTWA